MYEKETFKRDLYILKIKRDLCIWKRELERRTICMEKGLQLRPTESLYSMSELQNIPCGRVTGSEQN